uniref:Uncharacterized protein n=1 Tax=Pygocentrus nattereri TaxID=42514 RepID=A0AAR2JWF1_PYGNA
MGNRDRRNRRPMGNRDEGRGWEQRNCNVHGGRQACGMSLETGGGLAAGCGHGIRHGTGCGHGIRHGTGCGCVCVCVRVCLCVCAWMTCALIRLNI